jgi:hypothetical protein
MNISHRKGTVKIIERLDSEMLAEAVMAELNGVGSEKSNVIPHPKNAGGAASSRLAKNG